MAFGSDKPSLKARALRLLAQREHSRVELARKLQRFEEEPGSLARILDDLQAKQFISEPRVVTSVLNRRSATMGNSRIKGELLSKGIEGAAIEDAMRQLQASEMERARALWLRRFGAPPADARERARQARFLIARGFPTSVVARVIKGLEED